MWWRKLNSTRFGFRRCPWTWWAVEINGWISAWSRSSWRPWMTRWRVTWWHQGLWQRNGKKWLSTEPDAWRAIAVKVGGSLVGWHRKSVLKVPRPWSSNRSNPQRQGEGNDQSEDQVMDREAGHLPDYDWRRWWSKQRPNWGGEPVQEEAASCDGYHKVGWVDVASSWEAIEIAAGETGNPSTSNATNWSFSGREKEEVAPTESIEHRSGQWSCFAPRLYDDFRLASSRRWSSASCSRCSSTRSPGGRSNQAMGGGGRSSSADTSLERKAAFAMPWCWHAFQVPGQMHTAGGGTSNSHGGLWTWILSGCTSSSCPTSTRWRTRSSSGRSSWNSGRSFAATATAWL